MFRPALDTTKYAIIYPRQSSKKQVEENVYSLEHQMLLREVALRDGFSDELIKVVDDDLGLSGRSIEKRPGFSRALQMIEKGLVGAIYAEDQTRLSRDERTIDHMRIADVCERGGALIYIGGAWYDMRDSGQRQSFKYQAVGGSEYWKAHLQKMHAAQRQKALGGRAVAKPPRGYRTHTTDDKNDPMRDRFAIHEGEADIIRALVAELADAGSVMALHRRHAPLRWPDGAELTYAALYRILTLPTYRGVYVWGDVRVEGAHEAIITPAQGAEIDGLIALSKATRKRAADDSAGAELVGLVWCATCERRVSASAGGHSPCYRCQATERGLRVAGGHHFSLAIDVIDAAAREQLFRRLGDGMLDTILAAIKTEKARRASAGLEVEAERVRVERRIEGWLQSLSDPSLGETVRKMIQGQLEDAARKLEDLSRPRPVADLADEGFYLKLRKDPDFTATLPATWGDEPLAWRRRFLRRFLARVEVARVAGGLTLALHWLDGEVTMAAPPTRGWSAAEVDLLHELAADPACPRGRVGRLAWFYLEFTARGFDRPSAGFRKKLSEMGLLMAPEKTDRRRDRHRRPEVVGRGRA